MRAGDDGDDAEEDAEEDDGVVVVVLATSRDRREAQATAPSGSRESQRR